MVFIKKKQELVTEEAANPLEQSMETSNDITSKAQQAIMKLLEGEADAINQYAQAMEMVEASEAWLSEAVMDTLKDIRREEKKHLAQLYSKVKEFPENAEDFEDGEEEAATGVDKESVKEAVVQGKVYDGSKVNDIITNHTIGFEYGTQEYEALDTLASYIDFERDYTAQEIDNALAQFAIDPNTLQQIEAEISELPDAKQERIKEFKSDLEMDIQAISDLIDDSKLFTFAARHRLNELIMGLKEIEYDGSRDTVWNTTEWENSRNKKVIA